MILSRQFWNNNSIHIFNQFGNGGLYDNTGGNKYTPPPPPTPLNNILLEDGSRILLENGNYLAMEN